VANFKVKRTIAVTMTIGIIGHRKGTESILNTLDADENLKARPCLLVFKNSIDESVVEKNAPVAR
jgi:hypothetical protein